MASARPARTQRPWAVRRQIIADAHDDRMGQRAGIERDARIVADRGVDEQIERQDGATEGRHAARHEPRELYSSSAVAKRRFLMPEFAS